MSKNNKEKSSFWKKLGLGKNKTSASSMTSDHDKNSMKSKRLSSVQIQPPLPIPPTPTPTRITVEPIIKQPRATLPKVQSLASIHVDNNDISYESVTPTALEKEFATEPNVTHTSDSFVVVKSNDGEPDPNTELLDIIAQLKLELENEKATVNVLQLQKQAVTKDLDYFELSVDELLTEKTDLLQQLEDEKIKNQHYLDDLNLSLEKQKATADNARGQSFAVDQTKLEFESVQEQWRQEQKELMSEISSKEKTVRELRSKLNKSQEQVDALHTAMDQLIKSHSEELSRLAAEKEKMAYTLHTPSGSPRMQPNEDIIPVPSSSAQEDAKIEYNNDLDDQLMKLTKEKEKLQSIYSKIPLSGGGPQSRRRKEELEAMLDQVDSKLSKVKQKIRRS